MHERDGIKVAKESSGLQQTFQTSHKTQSPDSSSLFFMTKPLYNFSKASYLRRYIVIQILFNI